ncbi:MAG: ATP-dependent helicase [Bacteroides sp.]|nr:ATP-dependent helicase [Bacteroides sp.]
MKGNINYLSDLFFILSVLGYSRADDLLPSGIEVYLTSTEPIDASNEGSEDKSIYHDFTEVQEIRELKLISLQVLSTLPPGEQDVFIKSFFAAKTKLELINNLQDKGQIDEDHPIFQQFRGDAIKYQEDHWLNEEQRAIYDAGTNQHIHVMAGPGSGKTHTLTLRVARLVYYKFANPEEILVLAYNRAVVSELKERLGKLFRSLGFGNLSNRIKIYTFHGLAKKYAQEQLEGLRFEEWEPRLLDILRESPGSIMGKLSPLKHILVDEFQDINEVRMDILNRITELTEAYLFIIGDPNQSIYGYDRAFMDPYHYYEDFDTRFNPQKFELSYNHRSYPDILALASRVLPDSHQGVTLHATQSPDDSYRKDYVQVHDCTQTPIKWWNQLELLFSEKVRQKEDHHSQPYKQIDIIFRTNNEVYRGFQKIKSMELPNVRIRIQGSLPYKFTWIRECHALIHSLKSETALQLPSNFRETFDSSVKKLIEENPNWNQFYMHVVQALVLEYLDEPDEEHTYAGLLEFIEEMSYKDDGQLYKVYEKYLDKLGVATRETEIVLTTMHKVKGLEFDCVMIPPSFSNLPLIADERATQKELQEQLDEEKRLAFVACTRARYRLVIFHHDREIALAHNKGYTISEKQSKQLGISVQAGIDKLNIGWAANEHNFNRGINLYIRDNIRSGDSLIVRKRTVSHNGSTFDVYELFKENERTPIVIGSLSTGCVKSFMGHQEVSGFVVNEVVAWSYEETCKADVKNNTGYAEKWCQGAKEEGYIYLVDFAGFGNGR